MKKIRRVISSLAPQPLKRAVRRFRERTTLADQKGRSVIDLVERDGFLVAHRKGTADERVIDTHSFSKDIFFSALPDYTPSENATIVDIGAHIGTFSLLAARKAKNGRVISVEASRESFCLLKINALVNGMTNIACVHSAVCDADGEIALHHSAGNWGHSITTRLSRSSETVRGVSLETLFREHQINDCELIKFNCEGAEFPTLLAAPLETLQCIQRMLILYHCDLYGGATEQDLVKRLQQAGFETELRNVVNERGWLIATRGAAASR